MKKILKKAVKRIIGWPEKQVLASPDEFGKNTLMGHFFSNLKSIGFSPSHIVDVGANKGTWSELAAQFFPDAYFTLIEPQENLKKEGSKFLERYNGTWLSMGVGDRDGTLMLTSNERDDSFSFLFTREQAEAMGRDQVEVEVKSLNSIIKDFKLNMPEMVKVDAEGLDLEVLKGASDLFGITEVFLVEATVTNKIFSNSALEVIRFMDQVGYSLYDITDLNRTPQRKMLWLIELAFVKKNGIMDKASGMYE